MKSLARLTVRRRWYVLSVWVVLIVAINLLAHSEGSAYANAFSLPGTNSTHAVELLAKIPAKSGDVDQIVLQARSGTLDQQRARIDAMLAKVARLPEVASVVSPFCPTSAPCPGALQINRQRTIAYAVVNFSQQAFRLPLPDIRAVETAGASIRSSSLNVQFGGNAFGQLDAPTGSPGEIFGLIATALILLFAFGSFLAMLLPLGVALFAIGVASGRFRVFSGFGDKGPIRQGGSRWRF